MTSQETPAPAPVPADLPAGETAASPEELGHLVKGLDFSGVVEWAKGQNIPGYEALDGMVGSKQITIDGLKATVGWVKHREAPNKEKNRGFSPEVNVDNPGGEDIVVVEGGIIAQVAGPHREGAVTLNAEAKDGRPGFMQFNGGDSVYLGVPWGQEAPSWYVCFYPDGAAPAAEASAAAEQPPAV